MSQLYGIYFNYKHSFRDFGLTLKSPPKMDGPEPRIITETVPYMDGAYDFSEINGGLTYDNRTLVFDFNLISNDYNDMYIKFAKVKAWLQSAM